MKKGTKKVFAWVMTFALLLSLVPAMGVTALADGNGVSYLYPVYNKTDGDFYQNASSGIKEWKTDTCTSYTSVTTGTTTWGTSGEETWYVVNGNVGSTSTTFTVSGDVHLILVNGKTLTAKNIVVATGNSLTIYGQESGAGTLSIASKPADNTAGIGGTYGVSSGPITINGGTVTVYGGTRAAGIGGGRNAAGTNITINGGSVTARGGQFGAGIGGGDVGNGENITINGGTVNASCGRGATNDYKYYGGAGIGGGTKKAGSYITINGGDVTANGANGTYGGAGIGGGSEGEQCTGSNITIRGGKVTATGGKFGAGIGGGNRAAGTNITIEGGEVTANGGDGGGAGIGSGGSGAGSSIVIKGGKVTATGGNPANTKDKSSGIGKSFYGKASSSIYVATGLVLKAGESSASNLISSHSLSEDSKSSLDDKRYATVTTSHSCNYSSWTSTTSLPTSGSYCLTKDVTVSSQTTLIGNLNLCLNGKNITVSPSMSGQAVFNVGTNTLNIIDCTGRECGQSTGTPATCEADGVGPGIYYKNVFDNIVWLVPGQVLPKLGHSWTYKADGATITETCSRDNCGQVGGSYTVTAPTDLSYTGLAKTATVEGTMTGVTAPDIVYKQGETELTKNPMFPGTYTANITVQDKTASTEFTISSTGAHDESTQLEANTSTDADKHLYFVFSTGASKYKHPQRISDLLHTSWSSSSGMITFKVLVKNLGQDETVTVTLE